MDPITLGLLLGGGLGLGKGVLDSEKERKDRKQAAETARWAPWTGMQPDKVKRADPLGSTMQGTIAGGTFAGANEGRLSKLMGGEEAAAGVTPELTGAQSVAPANASAPLSPNDPNYNTLLLQKYPWLAMQAG